MPRQGFKPYRAEPGQEFGFTRADGSQETIRADDRGLVLAEDEEQERVLAGFDLPHGHPSEHDAGSGVVKRLNRERAEREADADKPGKADGGAD